MLHNTLSASLHIPREETECSIREKRDRSTTPGTDPYT
jgi:hypothetical protein